MNNKACVGVIIGAHGIRGEVKIRSFTSPVANIKNYPFLQDDKLKDYKLKFRSSDNNNDILIAAIEGIGDRNQAETLKSTELFINKEDLPDTPEDEFYFDDLVGLEVISKQDNKILGKVLGVFNFGAGDILEIGNDQKDSRYFEFNDHNFPEINLLEKKIWFSLPEEI